MTSPESILLSWMLVIAPVEAKPTENELCLQANLCDATELPPPTFAAVKEEASAIYAEAGLSLDWLHMCSAEDSASLAQKDVAKVYVLAEIPTPVVFDGRRFSKPPLMGYDLSEPDRSLGSVIYLSRQVIETLLRTDDPERLARALGRITAHELAHRFLQSGHVPNGILRAEIENADWIDDDPSDLYFTDDQIEALRSEASECTPEPE